MFLRLLVQIFQGKILLNNNIFILLNELEECVCYNLKLDIILKYHSTLIVGLYTKLTLSFK